MVGVDSNGLCEFTMNGRDGDVSGDELQAIVADHLPADCRHLWPVWAERNGKRREMIAHGEL